MYYPGNLIDTVKINQDEFEYSQVKDESFTEDNYLN